MSFLNGFEKEAGSLPGMGGKITGRIIGEPIAGLKRLGIGSGKFMKEFSSGVKKGVKESITPPKANISGVIRTAPEGSALGGHRLNKMKAAETAAIKARSEGHPVDIKPVMTGDKEKAYSDASKNVLERHQRMKDFKKKQGAGPSFASRHPYITAGGSFLAAKTIFEPKKEEDSRPAVLYPQ